MSDAAKDNLQDLLNELESEIAAEPGPKSSGPNLQVIPGGATAPGTSSNDAPLEQTLGNLKEESTPDSLLDQDLEKEIDSAMDQLKLPSPKSGPGALTLSLQGSMTLKLQFEQNGQAVTVRLDENYLWVTLANGAEFKLPHS